jgi:hypothetical protein
MVSILYNGAGDRPSSAVNFSNAASSLPISSANINACASQHKHHTALAPLRGGRHFIISLHSATTHRLSHSTIYTDGSRVDRNKAM